MFSEANPLFEFRGPFGVPVQVNPSIVLLVLLFVAIGGSADMMAFDLLFVAMLIGSIFLHELGHAWGCLIQGVPVRRIVLHGGGGFCEHRHAVTAEQDELIVAMGPIVNLTIWAVAGLMLPYTSGGMVTWAVATLGWMNLFLAVFNLIPVMPLDGGKLFQLLLMRFTTASLATRISGAVGLVIAILWIPAMVLSYMYVGLVLFFIPAIALHWQMLRQA
ncbi:site-2 protease family protein [Actibacterium sp. 188UL27-1]|uniref:site-2 protease family protein n=1 Tax=Actibacterium sp. 188UL27-1 TaxID=2786961 RepID=UPI00195B5224|nr:site-2 protease family protein [Actibacterium sp. 188UL27-1]MBM7066136.1 site-2 protease family protein [Actibacterium sp. 188UL27-1]